MKDICCMPSRKRTDLIDFITPSRRGHLYYRRILQEAALNPQRWMRHHFIVVFDDDHEHNVHALLRWLDKARETMVLPRVSATNAPAASPDILRQIGLSIGTNPYVYFQDDDDPLPLHLDERMAMMEHGHLDAVFGATETITERGVTVEQFPRIVHGRFVSDVLAGQAMFPSYGHPLAALFTRKVLKVPAVLKSPTADIAVYKLANRHAALTTTIEDRYKFTIKLLERIADGKAALGADEPRVSSDPSTSIGGAAFSANARVFSRKTLP